jgi:molybdopterin molybdotransferase
MISHEEALNLVLQSATAMSPWRMPVEDARGHTLAEDVFADRDCPPFPRSMMDGYAVRLADAGRGLPVAGEIPAGSVWSGELVDGVCLEILTGAACPPGTEAVVPKELVERQADRVTLPGAISPGENIAAAGSECRQGERILRSGMNITPMAIGAMVAFGVQRVRVIPRPMLAVISTGEEFAPPGKPPGPGQIRNSNGEMLIAMARDYGIPGPWQRTVADRLEDIVRALRGVSQLDIVVLTGGVSAGTYDLVPQAIAKYGAERIFHGVNQRPGKPLLFARKDRQLIFGLPGNPLASHFGFHRYVSAAIRKMAGQAVAVDSFQGELVQPLAPKGGRPRFIPGQARYAADRPCQWQVGITAGVSSADIFRGCEANCYVEVPSNRALEAGDLCAFTWLGRLPWG